MAGDSEMPTGLHLYRRRPRANRTPFEEDACQRRLAHGTRITCNPEAGIGWAVQKSASGTPSPFVVSLRIADHPPVISSVPGDSVLRPAFRAAFGKIDAFEISRN